MNYTDQILIEAKDCSYLDSQNIHDDVLKHFIYSFSRGNILYLSPEKKEDEHIKVIEYDFIKRNWIAGRFVGEASFSFQDKNYKIFIRPRFGEIFLFRMLEEIYQIKLSETRGIYNRTHDFQLLIKKLIAFIWLNLLANSNKHGLPRNTVKKTHKGSIIRGRINIPQSIHPFFTSGKIVSTSWIKEAYEIISQILYQAYLILLNDYSLSLFIYSGNARDAIIQLESYKFRPRYINDNEYQNIHYSEIYKNFKPIVDLSWQLIQRKRIANQLQDKNLPNYCYFIDIAEVWELYLKSILKNHLSPRGWVLIKENLITYEGKIFKRQLIPDMVFQKNDNILVFDAKYKQMYLREIDFDRTDFFQIHTYISYYQQNRNVLCGGLLYPFSVSFTNENYPKSISQSYFGLNLTPIKFIIDGIDLSFRIDNNPQEESTKYFKRMENMFLERIDNIIDL